MHFEGTVIHVQKLGRKTLMHKKDEKQTSSQPSIPKFSCAGSSRYWDTSLQISVDQLEVYAYINSLSSNFFLQIFAFV